MLLVAGSVPERGALHWFANVDAGWKTPCCHPDEGGGDGGGGGGDAATLPPPPPPQAAKVSTRENILRRWANGFLKMIPPCGVYPAMGKSYPQKAMATLSRMSIRLSIKSPIYLSRISSTLRKNASSLASFHPFFSLRLIFGGIRTCCIRSFTSVQ